MEILQKPPGTSRHSEMLRRDNAVGLLMAFRGTCSKPLVGVSQSVSQSVMQCQGAAEGWKSRAGCRKVCNKDRSYFGEERKEEEEALPFAHLFCCPGLGSVSDGEFFWSVAEPDWRLPSVLTSLSCAHRAAPFQPLVWSADVRPHSCIFSSNHIACRKTQDRCPRPTAEGSPALCVGSSMGGISHEVLPLVPGSYPTWQRLCHPRGSHCSKSEVVV